MTDYTELKRLATRIVEVQTSQDVPISKLFDDFEAAACPETILALIAENERLEAINNQMILLECNGGTAQAAINLLAERDQLRAEVAGLKTGYEAYEQVNAELKAEVKTLRKHAHGKLADMSTSQEIIWCACGDGHAANSYGAGFIDANDGVCANCDAANQGVEPDLDTLRKALIDLLDLYDTDEGCRSLPQYIAGRAALGQGEQS